MGYIYKITNSVTKKCYIGETIQEDPNKRYKAHMNSIRIGGGCPALRDAVKKHGEDMFVFEVLIICFDEDRFIYEKEYIKKYNSMVPHGYNISDGGEGSSGFKHTDVTKARLSEITRKQFTNPENVIKLSQSIKKYYENPENRKAQSDRLKASDNVKNSAKLRYKDHKRSEESKKKVSESLKIYHSNNTNGGSASTKKKISEAMCIPIAQYTIDGVFIKNYTSTKEAASVLSVSKAGVSHVLTGKRKTSGGFKWKYTNIIE